MYIRRPASPISNRIEDKKVKVSIGKESKDTFIVLTAKDRNCSINFKDLIPHNSGKKTDSTQLCRPIALDAGDSQMLKLVRASTRIVAGYRFPLIDMPPLEDVDAEGKQDGGS
ncbi:hypothetical protein IFM89_007414 [Coptis chinensis]|uniref:Uncharacterized protein n=1 Tax=Coptis chinensis TaxID=261450 RepID=A0A835ITS3_9MAGN|nr:hypothetical protein IFM89_007414 [Coptis chinensis]